MVVLGYTLITHVCMTHKLYTTCGRCRIPEPPCTMYTMPCRHARERPTLDRATYEDLMLLLLLSGRTVSLCCGYPGCDPTGRFLCVPTTSYITPMCCSLCLQHLADSSRRQPCMRVRCFSSTRPASTCCPVTTRVVWMIPSCRHGVLRLDRSYMMQLHIATNLLDRRHRLETPG